MKELKVKKYFDYLALAGVLTNFLKERKTISPQAEALVHEFTKKVALSYIEALNDRLEHGVPEPMQNVIFEYITEMNKIEDLEETVEEFESRAKLGTTVIDG